MKRTLPRWAKSDTWLLWAACAVALYAGWYIAFDLFGNAIDRQELRSGRVAETLQATARDLAQRPRLEHAERVLDEHLRDFDIGADKPTTVAHFIGAAARIATAHHVNLDEVEQPGPAAAPFPEAETKRAPGSTFSFEAIPLEVTLSGTYADLLAAIRALAQAPVSMQIEIAAIERKPAAASSSDAPLAARLHVVLQRLTSSDDAALVSAANLSRQE